MVEAVEQTAGLKDAMVSSVEAICHDCMLTDVVLRVCAVHLWLCGCGLADSLE